METIEIILGVVGIVISLATGYYGSKWYFFKGKLSTVRTCIDKVDDALKDDKVSEQEYRDIWDNCYKRFTFHLEK